MIHTVRRVSPGPSFVFPAIAVLLCSPSLAAGEADDDAAASIAQLYQQMKLASVEILGQGHLDGSGWFADAQGTVVTAAHVVGRPGRRLEVLSSTAGRLEAKVLAVDYGHDLALLQVEPREGGYPTLPLAQRTPPPGENIYLMGAAIFRHAVLVRGMVARDDTVFEYYTDQYVETVHVAATVQSGMSGGPWCNRQGEVVGLQSAVMSTNSIPVGVAHMIPVEAIRELIAAGRHAANATIGASVEELWQQQADAMARFPQGTEGLVIRGVKGDGPAARAGLKVWDLIIAADEQAVRLSNDLLRAIRAKSPGDLIELTVVGPDGTGTRQVEILLGCLEAGWPDPE